MNLRDYPSVLSRRRALEKKMKASLASIGSCTLDESVASSRNCENMIGAVQVPVGVAGPLSLDGRQYYIPLATTEGALVASVSRGCKAITQSGGAVTDSYRVGATRGPVFVVNSLKESDALNTFLKKNVVKLQEIAVKTSHHLILKTYMDRGMGHYRFVRFVFDTQDAMGMNMATIATQAIVEFIESKTQARCVSLAGNYDVDKKPSWLNVIEGRGIKAWAEATIPGALLKSTLKTTARAVYDTWLAKCMMGSAMSGAMAFNAQFANVVAAVFLATGQDMAHVGEGGLGITTAEVVNGKDLYMSVYLPDLMIGTVGGGTGLSTQKEALSLLGVWGGNNGKQSLQFARIIAASVLAGELSLLSSLEQGTLAQAHQRLARGKS